MSEPRIVPVGDDDLVELHRVCSTAFGDESKEELVAAERPVVEWDRMIGVEDGGRLVASAGAYSFRLTVPGLATVPVAGVSWVGVLPTHRRQGILTGVMAHQLDDVADRGEPAAILTASEATIYGRFGYGVASRHLRARIRTRGSDFVTEPPATGSIRLAWSGDRAAIADMAAVWEAHRRERPGQVALHDGWWDVCAMDLEEWRKGRTKSFYAVHDDDEGQPDGYATWSVERGHGDDDNVAHVNEVVGLDPGVEAQLWRFLLDLDLTRAVVAETIAVDDPLPWRLRDPRCVTAEHLGDWLWARLLDVPAALSARTYGANGRLTFEVVDPFRPAGRAAGTFTLDARPDGASVERAGALDAEVSFTVEALGSAWLGTVAPSTLAAAGRASGTPEALAHADALFRAERAPWCSTGF